MSSHHARRELRYTQRQLFDLVADVEKYPEFIAWFVAMRIRRRDGNRLEVDQIVRFKGMHARFTTHAVFDPPRRIDVVSHDTLFKRFDQKWEFLPVDDHGTMVEYESTMEMRSSLLQHAMQALFDEPQIARKTLDAFVRRAQQVYGKR